MKFAKELEQEAVPEWRVKYLNYKLGKKLIKSVTRAIQRASTTPTLARRSDSQHPLHATPAALFHHLHHKRTLTHHRWSNATPGPHEDSPGTDFFPGGGPELGRATTKSSRHSRSSIDLGGERASLTRSPDSGIRYGSIVPPSRSSDRTEFELPAPAMRMASNIRSRRDSMQTSPVSNRAGPRRSMSMMIGAAGESTATESPVNVPRSATIAQRPTHRLTRLLSTSSHLSRTMSSKDEIGLQNLDTVRTAEVEFFSFLDNELDKIETFYKQKEDQATKRLTALREQLHEMRNRRTTEISDAKKRKEMEGNGSRSHSDDDGADNNGKDNNNGTDWIAPIRTKFMKPGPNSKALQKMTGTPVMSPHKPEEGRDYVRRPPNNDVPYRVAKRKLKLALQEFYRGLELLKSYALLNRTAFRKLNKKYDKAVNARPTYRYMNEKVNKTWFVNSDILDGHIRTVEDLYARYFEKGNHKLAAGKLRNILRRPGDASDSAFRSGLLVGLGAVFAVQGLTYGAELLFQDDHTLRENTSYLLQLYGGYFLMIMLFTLFTMACRIWTKNKVNYPFIFEFDTRHNLEWKQLAEFPSFFFALLGVFIWINFSRFGSNWEEMYLYYPVILIGVSLLIFFFPAPIFYHRARRWFLYSHYRLLLAGLYPVEFRDFFLGDIWCSLTYASSNIALFFCLYANEWDQPSMCNSSHSRVLGFFNALPPIWRALQCIRRYYDTKNVFPHLVNCGKYMMTIVTAVLLSLYRLEGSKPNLALYITFACINALYTSIWDLFMDFSLLQKHVRHPFLRDITALKSKWIYYAIMIVDPLLRFNWIFYAIFTHNTQHSTIVSFFVAFAEVIRRGLWLILRVENEHCANVSQYKASRDTPLPYQLEQFIERPSQETPAEETPAAAAASTAVETSTASATPAHQQQQQQQQQQQKKARSGTISSMAASIRERIRARGSIIAGATAPWSASTPAGAANEDEEGGHAVPDPSAAAAATPGGGNAAAGSASTPSGTTGTGTGFQLSNGGAFRRRHNESMGKKSILRVMAEAHKQDFEKRRPPEAVREQGGLGRRGSRSLHEDDDEEEEDDDDPDLRSEVEDEDDDDDDSDRRSVQEDRMEAREAETLVRRARGEPDDSVSE